MSCIEHLLHARHCSRHRDSATNQSPCSLGTDTLAAETGGKGIKNKIMLDWAKEMNRKRPGENTLDWAFLRGGLRPAG